MNETTSLYEFNQVNMAQIPPLDTIALKKLCIEAMSEIAIGSYWMLLNRETYNFTLFVNDDKLSRAEKGEALFNTLCNRGKVTDFTKQPNGAWEIWIRVPTVNGSADLVYYFFNYDLGVVEV